MFNHTFEKYEVKSTYYPGFTEEISKLKADLKIAEQIKSRAEFKPIVEIMKTELAELEEKQKSLKDSYYKESQEKQAEFKADLEEYFDIQNNPKKDKLYAKACELGHSYGYSEIYNYYSDLVDLIK